MKTHDARIIAAFVSLTILAAASAAPAAQVAQLTPDNWDSLVPGGKEVDAIYGDYALRNDQLVAVVAAPTPGRNANLSVRPAGGYLLDLTTLADDNDQLTAWAPFARGFLAREAEMIAPSSADQPAALLIRGRGGPNNAVTFETRFTLAESDAALTVTTTYTNTGGVAVTFDLAELLRADRTFDMTTAESDRLVIVHDPWWRAAYGFLRAEPDATFIANRRDAWMGPVDLTPAGPASTAQLTLAADQSHTVTRRIIPGPSALAVRSAAMQLLGAAAHPVTIAVAPALIDRRELARILGGPGRGRGPGPRGGFGGNTAPGATAGPLIELWPSRTIEGPPLASARLPAGGGFNAPPPSASFNLPAGTYGIRITDPTRGSVESLLVVSGASETLINNLPAPAVVAASITDTDANPIPVKVRFIGADGTPDPFFFPDSGDRVVHNLIYDEDGRFAQQLPAGSYRVLISRGPEYDLVEQTLTLAAGSITPLSAQLKRTVDTTGYISADFHSHSSPSGDNTSSQFGRVLNLLAEQIEFAPCTEHNRINSYTPHLEALGATALMATVEGMELTGNPLPLNHQNAFPLTMKPHTQDWGAPTVDQDPVAQIRRLALWDDNSDKLVQQNHPDIVTMAFDRDGDGKRDEALTDMFAYMDVIEVHPLEPLFQPAVVKEGRLTGDNTIHSWLLLLNQGQRVPGVVNTDAHYNFHGSGWIRNWIVSPTDNPADVKVADIVHESERGHLIMSTGPFMKVSMRSGDATALPGDDLRAAAGGGVTIHVQVQCPNWLDIDRVQLFVNGRPDPRYNFTRAANPDRFGSGVVKFEQTIGVTLDRDAHVIVAAIGENHNLASVYGRTGANMKPVAVANPVYVDVDGGGFTPSLDTLDTPFPR